MESDTCISMSNIYQLKVNETRQNYHVSQCFNYMYTPFPPKDFKRQIYFTDKMALLKFLFSLHIHVYFLNFKNFNIEKIEKKAK